ncbi:MAG TPA: hypothetical protein VFT42_00440, partial [Solirubrobacteraceae bacterium]|nr:hypothetical protein [Solirubrobacteraceae bacterium]
GITCIRITGSKVDVLHQLPSQADDDPLPPCQGRSAAEAVRVRHGVRHRRHQRRHHVRRHHRHHSRHAVRHRRHARRR